MIVDHVPRTLAAKHHALEQSLRRHAAHLVEHRPVAPDPSTPAGRRILRGIPVVGMGGLDTRRDPLLVVLDSVR